MPTDAPNLRDGNGQIPDGLEPIAVAACTAAALFGVSESTWRRMERDGLVPDAVQMRGSPRWMVAELRLWAAEGCPTRAKWRKSLDRAVG